MKKIHIIIVLLIVLTIIYLSLIKKKENLNEISPGTNEKIITEFDFTNAKMINNFNEWKNYFTDTDPVGKSVKFILYNKNASYATTFIVIKFNSETFLSYSVPSVTYNLNKLTIPKK